MILQIVQPQIGEKRKNLDADIFPEKPEADYVPRNTTDWRNRTGKTKKARAKNMQPSIASLFSKVLLRLFVSDGQGPIKPFM
jgi:hypothetical protein